MNGLRAFFPPRQSLAKRPKAPAHLAAVPGPAATGWAATPGQAARLEAAGREADDLLRGAEAGFRRRLGATFTARPAPPTRPMDALPVSAAAPAATPAPQPLPPLPEGADVLKPAFGDWLAGHWPPLRESREEALEELWPRLNALTYPRHNLNAAFRDYAALLREVDEITGTRGTPVWPLPALPASDPRWGALANAVLAAAWKHEDSRPAVSGAYLRLYEAVLAAWDYETALRLIRVAIEAGLASPRDLGEEPAVEAGAR